VYVSKQELNTNSLCSRSSHSTKHNSDKQLNYYTPYERAKYRKFCCGSGRQTPLLLLSQFFLCPPPPLTTTPDYTGLSGFHYNRNKTKILVFIAALDGLVVNTSSRTLSKTIPNIKPKIISIGVHFGMKLVSLNARIRGEIKNGW
jgi:hypothetical protein